jgi:hypothetical protein
MTGTPATGLQTGQIRVAGTGAIWKAPIGSTLPTDSTTALDPAFHNLGYTKSGFVFTPSRKTQPVTGWQSLNTLRLLVTEKTNKLGFELLQSNADTLALAWDGTVVPGTGTAFTINVPDGVVADEYAYVVDMIDGTVSYRFVLQRGALLTPPTIKGDRTAETSYAFEIQPLIPADGSNSIKIYGADVAVTG